MTDHNGPRLTTITALLATAAAALIAILLVTWPAAPGHPDAVGPVATPSAPRINR